MDNNLDRILSSEPNVTPSPHFVKNVMAAVHREASIPAPISFPWRRAIPGSAICFAALACLLVVAGFQFSDRSAETGAASIFVLNVVGVAHRVELGWVLLALVASFVPARLALARPLILPHKSDFR